VLTGKDPWYVRAQKLGRLYVPYDENGHPLKQRVGRHIAGIQELAFSWTLNNPDVPIEFLSVPSYVDLMERGIGPYLLSSVTKLVGQ
jgi:hypothetical protein